TTFCLLGTTGRRTCTLFPYTTLFRSVVADDEAGDSGVARDDPDLLRLVDDVADRRDQPVGADPRAVADALGAEQAGAHRVGRNRSEEHTSELQSREKLLCRLLLENNN